MKIVNNNNRKVVDLDAIIDEAFKKYEAVFFSEIDDFLFIYRPLTRKEYKDTLSNDTISDYEKQDEMCRLALVYPEDFDFDDCSAGLPNQLFNEILEKSCLDPESMYYMLNIQRDEAEQLASEMVCLIAEAFPSYTIDEIESWNNFKFIKIYAQAEWVLKNIRGVEFQIDVLDYLAQVAGITEEEQVQMGFKDSQEVPQNKQEIQEQNGNSNNNKKMSPEQMRAYQEFVKQHPEFADAMQYDAAFTGMETMSVDTVNPALRPGWYHNH